MNIQILIETTLNQLRRNTEAIFGSEREEDSATIKVTNIVIVNHSAALEIKCNVHNMNEKTNHHVKILFEGIDVGNEGEKELDIMTVSGDMISVNRSELEATDVKVVCNCLDFYWRFAMWNFADGSLLGNKPKPYVKRTNRAPNNPSKTPGMCKHIISTIDHFITISS